MKKILSIFLVIIFLLLSVMPTKVSALSNDVFLNGTLGNDGNSGSTPSNAVSTFAKAKSLLTAGGTIWICGEVSIAATEDWDLSGYGSGGIGNGTIKRWDGSSVPGLTGVDTNQYKGSLISVNSRS